MRALKALETVGRLEEQGELQAKSLKQKKKQQKQKGKLRALRVKRRKLTLKQNRNKRPKRKCEEKLVQC